MATNKKARLVVSVLLILTGLAIALYSYSRLEGQEILFDQNSVQLGAHSYWSYDMANVNLSGKYGAMVTGGVGGPGCCVDFYLVNDTSWNSWSRNPEMRIAYSMVHLNATVVSAQLAGDQFSFVPPASAGYQAVFVNDEYPSASNASMDASVTLHYDSTSALYATIAGLVILASGTFLLGLTVTREGRKPENPSISHLQRR